MPAIALFGLLTLTSRPVSAYVHTLSSDIAREAVSESVPTAFAPGSMASEDYTLEWDGAPLSGVRFSLGRKSLEWVRVSEVLVVPRARLMIRAEGVTDGQISNGGFHQALDTREGVGFAAIPIALISGDRNPIHLSIVRKDGGVEKGTLLVRYRPKNPQKSPVFVDSGCSSFRLTVESTGAKQDEWAYIGCRLVYAQGDSHRTSTLELFVFWDGVGQSVRIGGIDTPASSPSVWALRLKSTPGSVKLVAGQHELRIGYRIAEKLKLGSLGVGVGPYLYKFDSPGVNVNTVAPLVTLYGSYFVSETMRVVAFNATAVHGKLNTDLGVYLNSESVRSMDRRFSLNLMLGGHLLGFASEGGNRFVFGAPQGVEAILRDAVLPGYSAALGAFIYPSIQGKAYYNVWLRWGTDGVFAEFNYISWEERWSNLRAFSRSAGICVGFPLVRFL